MPVDLLFEIGVEELPSAYVEPALKGLAGWAEKKLVSWRLSHQGIRMYGTPRRLTLTVSQLADRQTDEDKEFSGPAVRAAYDADGNPTPALIGFCKRVGVEVSDVRRVTDAKGERVVVTRKEIGKAVSDPAVLPDLLGALTLELYFPKRMKWAPPGISVSATESGPGRRVIITESAFGFPRPVRWLVALLGNQVVPVDLWGVRAGTESRGHRFLHPGTVPIARASDYLDLLEQAFVIADPARRR